MSKLDFATSSITVDICFKADDITKSNPLELRTLRTPYSSYPKSSKGSLSIMDILKHKKES